MRDSQLSVSCAHFAVRRSSFQTARFQGNFRFTCSNWNAVPTLPKVWNEIWREKFTFWFLFFFQMNFPLKFNDEQKRNRSLNPAGHWGCTSQRIRSISRSKWLDYRAVIASPATWSHLYSSGPLFIHPRVSQEAAKSPLITKVHSESLSPPSPPPLCVFFFFKKNKNGVSRVVRTRGRFVSDATRIFTEYYDRLKDGVTQSRTTHAAIRVLIETFYHLT